MHVGCSQTWSFKELHHLRLQNTSMMMCKPLCIFAGTIIVSCPRSPRKKTCKTSNNLVALQMGLILCMKEAHFFTCFQHIIDLLWSHILALWLTLRARIGVLCAVCKEVGVCGVVEERLASHTQSAIQAGTVTETNSHCHQTSRRTLHYLIISHDVLVSYKVVNWISKSIWLGLC